MPRFGHPLLALLMALATCVASNHPAQAEEQGAAPGPADQSQSASQGGVFDRDTRRVPPGAETHEPMQVRRFNDWELLCPLSPRAARPPSVEAASACRLQQAQAVNDGKDVVFLFSVVMQRGQPIAIVSTPLNVYLPAGLSLAIDGGATRQAVFETCNITGCHAGFALAGPLLTGLKRGRVLTVTMRDTKATEVPVKVSLKGVTAGLSALAER